MAVLPPLREGFGALSPADRRRLLKTLGELLKDDILAGRPLSAGVDWAPALLAHWSAADLAGGEAVAALKMPGEEMTPDVAGTGERSAPSRQVQGSAAGRPGPKLPAHKLSVADRWRLILGQQREQMSRDALRGHIALERLYGVGGAKGERGEGARHRWSREGRHPGLRGGSGGSRRRDLRPAPREARHG